MERKHVGTISWEDLRGREQVREINYTLDVRDFQGTRGYPWLLIAANRHLSADVLRLLLLTAGEKYERSRSWIARKKRYLFKDPDTLDSPGARPNADGKDALAIQIMRENRTISARALSRLLSKHGIRRGKDWVLVHRCD